MCAPPGLEEPAVRFAFPGAAVLIRLETEALEVSLKERGHRALGSDDRAVVQPEQSDLRADEEDVLHPVAQDLLRQHLQRRIT